MLEINNIEVEGFRQAIYILRKSTDTLNESDSGFCKGGVDGIGCSNCANQYTCTHEYDKSFQLGKRDYERLIYSSSIQNKNSNHFNLLKVIRVFCEITAPLYWWQEFEAETASGIIQFYEPLSVSVIKKDLNESDFIFGKEYEGLDVCENTLKLLNTVKGRMHKPNMLSLIPLSYLHNRYVIMDFYILKNLFEYNYEFKNNEWNIFYEYIRSMPWHRIITEY